MTGIVEGEAAPMLRVVDEVAAWGGGLRWRGWVDDQRIGGKARDGWEGANLPRDRERAMDMGSWGFTQILYKHTFF